MSQRAKRPFASLAEAERLIRAGRALLSWAGDGDRNGNYAEAERCFRGALEILRDAVDSGHPQLALAWDRLGVLYEEMGVPGEAETCYLRSLAAQQAAGWSSAVGQGLTVRRLGRLYGQMGKKTLQRAVMSTLEPSPAERVVPPAASGPRLARERRRKSKIFPDEAKRFTRPPPRD